MYLNLLSQLEPNALTSIFCVGNTRPLSQTSDWVTVS